MVRALLAVTLALAAGCAERRVTIVALTFSGDFFGPADEGAHYELFATVNGGAVSLMALDVRVEKGNCGLRKVVFDADEPEVTLGVTDGFDDFCRPIGGVRFHAPMDLTGATGVFLTVELDGDTDPVPSREVAMACTLSAIAPGTLSCALASVDDKDFVVGTASLVLPDGGVNPL